MTPKKIYTPLDDETITNLQAGDEVLLNGTILTGRDAAHKRLCDLLANGEKLPVDLTGMIIYFVGPTPAKPGKPIGSAGPTTSYRMDAYSPQLIREAGLKGMIGKGERSDEVVKAMIEKKAVYFAAIGGAGALISASITDARIIAYEDLGPEAIRLITVKDFPCVVATDCYGNNLYETGPAKYRK